MKIIKKATCIILSVVLAAGAVSASVVAANDATTQSYLFSSKYTSAVNNYTDYKNNKYDSLQFAIPGLSNGTTGGVKISAGFYRDYVPQGITYDNHTQKYYMSAYSESKQNTVIYVVSKSGTYERTLELTGYTGHSGGVASDGRYLYFVSGLSIYYVGLDSIKTAINSSSSNTVSIPSSARSRIAVNTSLCGVNVGDYTDSSNVFSSCSFCTYFNGLFWFGEFSLNESNDDYPYRSTGESYFFGVDLSTPSSPVLKKVMTVPCKTQGATFFKNSSNEVYLACSMSYGRNNASTMRLYKINQSEWSTDNGVGTGTQASTGITKFVHKNSAIKNLSMPNMMEDICTRANGSKLYIMSVYESGTLKYYDSASYVMDRVSAIDINSALSITSSVTQPSVQHIYAQTGTTAPGCTTAGSDQYTCTICTSQKSETIPATGHSPVEHVYNPQNGVANSGAIYYTCENCDTCWGTTYDSSLNKYVQAEEVSTPEEAIAASKETAPVPAPTFNTYEDSNIDYNYSTRGASLKICEPFTYSDANTRQHMRFAASMLVPEGVSYECNPSGTDCITDFGFVYSQAELMGYDPANLYQGAPNVYTMSVSGNNFTDHGTFNGSNWTGVSTHQEGADMVLTFNLVVKIKAYNWTKDYCAKAYITYNYHGYNYTVYDSDWSHRNIVNIAYAVVANEGETLKVRNYCQSKILDNYEKAL